MSITTKIKSELWETLTQLPEEYQQKVLEFAITLRQQILTKKWDKISDLEADSLRSEFEEEDLLFAENNLSDYIFSLEKEDKM